MSIVLNVPQHVARNPVARSIERARLRKHCADTVAEMRSTPDWANVPSLICGVAEALAMAIKTIEGWDDPDSVGDLMMEGIDALKDMAEAGNCWRVQHTGLLCDALDCAVQVLSGMPAEAKVKAWMWAQAIEAAERERALVDYGEA